MLAYILLQTVSNLNAIETLVLENESNGGVVFGSAISVTELFDHNGNVFKLYNNGSGSSFVDYDGDGCQDHLDIDSTVYNLLYSYKTVCDVNKDNKTNLKDLIRVKKNVANIRDDLTADITGDTVVNADDLVVLTHYLLTDFDFFESLSK